MDAESKYKFSNKTEWATTMEHVNEQRKSTPWTLARLMLHGLTTYCHTKGDIGALYEEMAEQLEMSRKTLMNYASTARRFPPDQVHERLDIGHHVVVVAMPDDIADYWLTQAEMNGWSVAKLRQEIRAMAQTPTEDEDDEDDSSLIRSAVARALAGYGINASVEEKILSMVFPDGKAITVGANAGLEWSIR